MRILTAATLRRSAALRLALRRGFIRYILAKSLCLVALALVPVGLARAQNNSASNYTTPYVFTTLAGTAPNQGSQDGTGPAAQFNNPTAVADISNNTIRVGTPVGGSN